jgi:hypothetical protein
LKLEAIARSGQGNAFFATVAGFEYTLYQVLESEADLGLISEYHVDGRHASAPPTIFDKDLMVGARLGFNNAADSSVLAGAIIDFDMRTTALTVEAGTRLADGLRVEIEAWIFPYGARGNFLSYFERDHTIRIRLLKFL